ncbi:hypothetical protein NOVO_06290 [Rickettsiales bacterium Ac37b]|nr:hypothetical protein NOVO_06290 [Rickettsiales bacterium Ac37b]
MRKLFKLLKKSLIMYLAIYASRPLNVNANSLNENQLQINNDNLLSSSSIPAENNYIDFSSKEHLLQTAINLVYANGKDYYNTNIYNQFNQYNEKLANFLTQKLLEKSEMQTFFLEKILDKNYIHSDQAILSSSGRDNFSKLLNNKLDLTPLFNKIYNDIPLPTFDAILNAFFNYLNFDDLQTLIELLPEDCDYANLPSYIVKSPNDKSNFNFYNIDIILIRNDLSPDMKIKLLKLLIDKNQTILPYEHLSINWSFGLTKLLINSNLQAVKFLNTIADPITMLYTYLHCLEKNKSHLTKQTLEFMTGEINSFINSYNNITKFPDAYRAFQLL